MQLEDEDHAVKAIADGRMDVKEFSTLGEYDVGQLLQVTILCLFFSIEF